MATIKSYTDVNQSRELVEIIPYETADMYYPTEGALPKFGVALSISNNIPCWSLAALLNVLPDVHLKKYIYGGITKYYATLVGIRQFNSKHYDNPVDACVAMIESIHELNLL